MPILQNFFKLFFLQLGLVVIVVCLGSVAPAQRQLPNFNRPRTYDVQHYSIGVKFDRQAKKVFGDTAVTLMPLKVALSRVDLDSVGLVYTSVTNSTDGSALKYRTHAGKISVELPRPLPPGETITIRFRYTATPQKGIYFVPARIENGMEVRSAQIWTQGEPDEARHWFPSFDFPSDKATTEQFITALEGETVIGNGELVETVKNNDDTVTFNYRMAVPHSTYLTSFVIGKYVERRDKFEKVPLAYYVYPGREAIVPDAFGKTPDILRVFQELTGVKFPFNKYDQTIVANFSFGGMENVTATTLADTEVFLASFDFARPTVEDLVSHEAAHSWFGNLVTCRNWAELWLNEGFATFMEAAYREKAYGRQSYLLKIRSDADQFMADDAVNPNRNGLFNRDAGDVDKLFDRPAITYNKGGAVIHMLREEIGDALFWKAVNLYLNRHRLENVETTDLKAVMEESAGRDLGWFFEQWVYGISYPKLDVKQSWNEATKTLQLTFTQVQKTDKLVPAAFQLPLDLNIVTPAGPRREKVTITKRLQTVSLKLDAPPTEIRIDPNEKIPLKSVRLASLPTAIAPR